MPQMAPLSWLNLFIYFAMVFILFNTMNYFSLLYKNNNTKQTKKMKLISWKW
uniref:ATP synthase complex subunit 8 n=1 Tax=Aquatica lateralis TaxID=7052 RepID=A0A347Z8L3_AQULA|nr:ATP synthase F0 subunit 8 [Aquatica lateralis]BBA21823.1 ATP synthase F0 subunit 8 [Aquatica lateralis]BDE56936.1 ATPase subunit 8 [Aquatica lateralis]